MSELSESALEAEGKVYTGAAAPSQPSYTDLVMEYVVAVLEDALIRQIPPYSGSRRQQPEPVGV